eukprot:scaffold13832_cov45-Isochrysis_galbana.AAC.1
MRGFSTAATPDAPPRSYVAYLVPREVGGTGGVSGVGAEQELEWVREYGHAIKIIGDGDGEARAEGAVFYFAEGTEQ